MCFPLITVLMAVFLQSATAEVRCPAGRVIVHQLGLGWSCRNLAELCDRCNTNGIKYGDAIVYDNYGHCASGLVCVDGTCVAVIE